jgi:adenylate kinase family enzyme
MAAESAAAKRGAGLKPATRRSCPIVPARNAILLIGPTGAGKTPLGELLDREGLWDRRCCHFDFGDRMRRIVAGTDGAVAAASAGLAIADVQFLRDVLASGALLENEHFHIAEKILRAFLAERRVGAKDLLVLNGLPRHVGQADDVAAIVNVRAVVELTCPADVVLARIRTNAGGDRAERNDDADAAVRAKLAIYGGRTALLLDHYRRHAAAVITVDVGVETTATDARAALQGRPPPAGV